MERNKDFRFPIGTIVQHFKREMITDEERAANMREGKVRMRQACL